MNVNFMDACHLRIIGKNIYKENVNQLKYAYIFIKDGSKYSKEYPMMIGAALLGISPILMVRGMQRKRIEAAMKLCTSWDDYKRAFVHQLEQEA